MKIISHRGNLRGPSEEENTPPQIYKALTRGFECEIDLWVADNKLMLGHDAPQSEIDTEFLETPGLWIHAKNFNALEFLQKTTLNYFWHDKDAATITSHGIIWCYPGNFTPSGITVLQGNNTNIQDKCYGVCTDYPLLFLKGS